MTDEQLERVRNMSLSPEQYQEFEKIRKDMSEFVQSFPDLAGTVEQANELYTRKQLRKLESLLALHCKKENIADLRLWCFKYYSI